MESIPSTFLNLISNERGNNRESVTVFGFAIAAIV